MLSKAQAASARRLDQAESQIKLGLEELTDHGLLCVISTSTGPAVPASISKQIDHPRPVTPARRSVPMAGFRKHWLGTWRRPIAGSRRNPFRGKELLLARHDSPGTKTLRRSGSCFREALRVRPDDADVLNNLGTAVWEQGRSSEATAYYLRAYQFKQNDFGILNNLGIALWEQGRPEKAVVLLPPRTPDQARLVRHPDEPGCLALRLGAVRRGLGLAHGRGTFSSPIRPMPGTTWA